MVATTIGIADPLLKFGLMPLEAPSQHEHGDEAGGNESHRQRQAEAGESQHGERGQHHELALREVDGAGGLPQERETQCRQGVDAARGHAGENELQQVGHVAAGWYAANLPLTTWGERQSPDLRDP
jgi:hypothetical protein